MDIITICQSCDPKLLEATIRYCDLNTKVPNPRGFIDPIGPCEAIIDSVLIKYSDSSNGEKSIAKRLRSCLAILKEYKCDMHIDRLILNLLEVTIPKKYWKDYLIEI